MLSVKDISNTTKELNKIPKEIKDKFNYKFNLGKGFVKSFIELSCEGAKVDLPISFIKKIVYESEMNYYVTIYSKYNYSILLHKKGQITVLFI